MQHVIITGRAAPEALREVADTVSDIGMEKHASRGGIKAMPGLGVLNMAPFHSFFIRICIFGARLPFCRTSGETPATSRKRAFRRSPCCCKPDDSASATVFAGRREGEDDGEPEDRPERL